MVLVTNVVIRWDQNPLIMANHTTFYFLHTLAGVNTLRPRQDGPHFPDDNFKWIFLNENEWISVKMLLKFVPRGPINKIRALVQIMAWRRSGDKPLSESVMASSPTHICVTRPQWVKTQRNQRKLPSVNCSAVMWCHKNTYCDAIWPIILRTFLSWSHEFSCQ